MHANQAEIDHLGASAVESKSKDLGFSSFTDVLLQVCSQVEAPLLFKSVMVTCLVREIKAVLRQIAWIGRGDG